MPYTYILYSSSLNKFYIGSTTLEPEQRLTKHLATHSGFTAKAKDWTIVYTEFFDTISDARKKEFHPFTNSVTIIRVNWVKSNPSN